MRLHLLRKFLRNRSRHYDLRTLQRQLAPATEGPKLGSFLRGYFCRQEVPEAKNAETSRTTLCLQIQIKQTTTRMTTKKRRIRVTRRRKRTMLEVAMRPADNSQNLRLFAITKLY